LKILLYQDYGDSKNWLGTYSPLDKIVKSRLWLVQGLYKTPLDENELENYLN